MHDENLAQSVLSYRTQRRHSVQSRLQELEAESLNEALPEGLRALVSSSSDIHHKQILRPPPSLLVYSCIFSGAIFGVLARKGLQVLTLYSGTFLEGVIWANFVACVVMGLAVESELFWAKLTESSKHDPKYASKAAVPLYVGITTGFCGSCSSFSSFILQAFTKAANLPPTSITYPNPAYGILGAIEVVVAHLAMSVCGFRLGVHLNRVTEKTNYSLSFRTYMLLETAVCVVGVLAYIVVIVLVAVKHEGDWRSWTFSCIFAPWGAFLRYILSKRFNPLLKTFPMGTFVANFSGSLILTVLVLLARGRSHADSPRQIVSSQIGCHILQGLDDGFCGCLTTVSTFVVELLALDHSNSYRYGSVSILLSFCGMLLILGSYNWAVGLVPPVCS